MRKTDAEKRKILKAIDKEVKAGSKVPEACKNNGISDATRANWRKQLGLQGNTTQFVQLDPETPAPAPRAKKRGQLMVIVGDPKDVVETLKGIA